MLGLQHVRKIEMQKTPATSPHESFRLKVQPRPYSIAPIDPRASIFYAPSKVSAVTVEYFFNFHLVRCAGNACSEPGLVLTE